VISPPDGRADFRLHGTLIKDVPWVCALLVTLAILICILAGISLRDKNAYSPVVNVNVGQFNMISAIMLMTWFGWGYAICSRWFLSHGINYVDVLNLGAPPMVDLFRPQRYLSALGIARLTSVIALIQGVSLCILISLWRFKYYYESAAIVVLVFIFHLWFLVVPLGFERDSRLALRTTLLRCCAAPFVHVFFLDNVVGDILTSAQGKCPVAPPQFNNTNWYLLLTLLCSVALSRIELSLCSLVAGSWWKDDISPSFAQTEPAVAFSSQCSSSSGIQTFLILPLLSILPFWIRFLQVFLRVLLYEFFVIFFIFSACENGGINGLILDGKKQEIL
jgi:hypothetical protein